jgi:hypothetical protein|tara:strand:- start:61 stop:510 length:450 start_codon:yes stop_codon:yes gene_type:complete
MTEDLDSTDSQENILNDLKKRAIALLSIAGIDQRKWSKMTGFSRGQYYRYHAMNSQGGATVRDLLHCCKVFDWSPNYLLFGIGPPKLSEAPTQTDSGAASLLQKIDGDAEKVLNLQDELGGIAIKNHILLRDIHEEIVAKKSKDDLIFK